MTQQEQHYLYNRSIAVIAREIQNKWTKIYFGAVPYLQAMKTLDNISDKYGCDSAASIINYFLSNASTWRGEDAKRIKLELKQILKSN